MPIWSSFSVKLVKIGTDGNRIPLFTFQHIFLMSMLFIQNVLAICLKNCSLEPRTAVPNLLICRSILILLMMFIPLNEGESCHSQQSWKYILICFCRYNRWGFQTPCQSMIQSVSEWPLALHTCWPFRCEQQISNYTHAHLCLWPHSPTVLQKRLCWTSGRWKDQTLAHSLQMVKLWGEFTII